MTDPVIAGLARLPGSVPDDMNEAVFDRWLAAESVLGPVWVATTRRGVSFVRPASALDDGEFREVYRTRFGRPLRLADAVPEGVGEALLGQEGPAPRLDLLGLGDFARDVLAATRAIPAGETRPYGWVAAEIGRPRAVRATGTVLARNPVPLLVPCHRVIRSDGDPGAYLFGAPAKARLLARERAHA